MEETRTFKHALPEDCPKSFIKARQLNVGVYSIEYFRITKVSPPNEADFVPQLFLSRCSEKVQKMKQEGDYDGLCQMASASLLKTENEAIKLIKKYKKMGKYIFCGVISSSDGLIVSSPSGDFPSHCSFFVYTGIDENRIFSKCIYP